MAGMMRGAGGSLFNTNSLSFQSLISSLLPDNTSRTQVALNLRDDDVPKVKVQVSFEALCIDSYHFIMDDLIPTYHLLGSNIIDLELLPFGNAKITSKETQTIQCQHGQAECDANSYEQCIIGIYPDPSSYLPMLECLFNVLPMGYSDDLFPSDIFESCSVVSGLDFSQIQACHDNVSQAWMLQLKNEERTPIDHTHVPWVTINGVRFDEEKDKLDAGICNAFVKDGGKKDVCDALLQEDIE